MADPHLGQWTYRHDRAGRLREQTDGKGQKVVFTYGATLGRLSSKQTYNADNQLVSTANYTYDSGDANHTVYKGQLFQVTDSEGWERKGYDTLGRLQKTTRHLDIKNQDYVTTYTYDAADRIASVVYPNGGPTVFNEYHFSGALKRTYRNGYNFYSATDSACFDEFGRVIQFTYGNGKTTTRSYYSVSKRLQSITVPSVFTRTYHYTAADDIKSINGTGLGDTDTAVTYDNLHRILTYTGLSGSYSYDAVGNVTRNAEGGGSAFTYGVRRKQAVKSAFTKTYLYDECGNMIVRRGGAAGAEALEYDAENRLTRFSQAGTLVVEYGYAADGARLWKRKNQSDLQVWIGNLYEEKDGKVLYHVFAGDQQVCTFEAASILNGGSGPSTTHVGYYYHQDLLNSSSALSGNTGAQLEVNVWHPFGRTQTASPQAGFKVSRQFTGQVLDTETGLYYYNARYYDPEIGRFIQPDTVIADLSNPQSYNRYSYCLNNPLKYTDPTGHAVIQAWQAAQLRLISAGGLLNNVGAYGISMGITAMNVFSLGSFGKNDALADRAIAGEISDAQFYGGIAVNGGVAAASVAAGGGAGGLLVKAAGTGLGASVGAGAVAGLASSTTDILGTRMGYGCLGIEYQQSVGQDLAQVGMGTAIGAVGGAAVYGINARFSGQLNGNSADDIRAQHGYVIKDSYNGDVVVKNGISGGGLNKNGTSPRANRQVNAWNRESGNTGRYRAEVVFQVKGGPGARRAALAAERAVSNQERATLDPTRHKKP